MTPPHSQDLGVRILILRLFSGPNRLSVSRKSNWYWRTRAALCLAVLLHCTAAAACVPARLFLLFTCETSSSDTSIASSAIDSAMTICALENTAPGNALENTAHVLAANIAMVWIPDSEDYANVIGRRRAANLMWHDRLWNQWRPRSASTSVACIEMIFADARTFNSSELTWIYAPRLIEVD
jgi:hypothetical protein